MTNHATTPAQSTPPTSSLPAAQPQAPAETMRPGTTPSPAPQPRSLQPAERSSAERQSLSPEDEAYRRVVAQIEANQYEAALKCAQAKGTTDVRLRNAAGVCLLRLGRHAAAVHALRPLVFAPDGLTLLRDVPDVVRLNFATALLLDGRSSGCTDILRHIDRKLPGVQRLRHSLRTWQSQLSFWNRLCWRMGLGAPQTVTLDYPPGELL